MNQMNVQFSLLDNFQQNICSKKKLFEKMAENVATLYICPCKERYTVAGRHTRAEQCPTCGRLNQPDHILD